MTIWILYAMMALAVVLLSIRIDNLQRSLDALRQRLERR